MNRRARWLTRRSVALFALAAAATVGFVELADELVEGELDGVDATVAMTLHRFGSPALDAVMMAFSSAGSGLVLTLAVIAAALWAWHEGERRMAMLTAGAGLVVELANAILKRGFERPRPDLFPLVPLPTSWSFPSGHAMGSMAIYGTIATLLVRLRPGWRPVVLPAAAALIALIGVSRVYLGVHWPTDVVAGWIAGTIPLVVSVHLLHRNEAITP